MDCSLPGSSVHGNLQARKLEWVDIFFSRGSFQPRDQTQVSVSTLAGGFFLPLLPPGQQTSSHVFIIIIIKHYMYKCINVVYCQHWDDKIRMYFYFSNYFENQGMSTQE